MTDENGHPWTCASLFAYFDEALERRDKAQEERAEALAAVMFERDRRYEAQFEASDRATTLALSAAEKAVTKAESATEKRFDASNEIRAAMVDQQRNLMPRLEYEQAHKNLEGRVGGAEGRLSTLEGRKTGFAAGWVLPFGIISGLVGMLGIITVIITLVGK